LCLLRGCLKVGIGIIALACAFGVFCVALGADAGFSPGRCCAALVCCILCVYWDSTPRACYVLYCGSFFFSADQGRTRGWVCQWTQKMGFFGRVSGGNAVPGTGFPLLMLNTRCSPGLDRCATWLDFDACACPSRGAGLIFANSAD